MLGVVAADAGDAPFRPGRVELYSFALCTTLGSCFIAGRDLGKFLDDPLRILESRLAGFDERQKPRRQACRCLFFRFRFALFLQLPDHAAVEIDHSIADQRADASLRSKDNDFHACLRMFS